MATKQTFTAGQVLTAAQMNTLQGYVGVVQVKSTTKTDTFTMSSSTFADVTGLSVSITPTSASNKILVIATMMAGMNNATAFNAQFVRDSTAIGIADTAGSRKRTTLAVYTDLNAAGQSATMSFLDSPNTTSATTYKIQISAQAAAAVYINRTDLDTDAATLPRGVSTITVMEVTP